MAVTKVEMPPPHLNAADSLTSGSLSGGGPTSSIASNASPSDTNGSSNSNNNNNNNNNNTISAPADSSDNQSSTPEPVGANNEQQQKPKQQQHHHQHTQSQQHQQTHHPYAAAHHMYVPPSSATTTTTTNVDQMPSHMYCSGMYSSVAAGSGGGGGGNDLQQQQTGTIIGYPNYLNNYETTSAAAYYHHHQQSPTAPVAPTTLPSSSLDYSNIGGGSSSTSSPTNQLLFSDYKSPQSTLRYHPYLNNPTSLLQGNSNTSAGANGSAGRANLNNSNTSDSSQTHLRRSVDEQAGAVASSAMNPSAVSTTSISPRIVSSSSPSSTSQQQHSGSPNCPQFQCKKCGFLCSNDTELTAHITNVHGGSNSPYSTGNAGVGTNFTNGPPHTSQQSSGSGNPGELLDLDSQKMIYPPTPGASTNAGGSDYQQTIHSVISSDPLHSMHSMERRQLSSWEHTQQPQQQQQQQEALSPYLQNEQKIATTVASNQAHNIQSPYYSPKQSPYPIKSEYPIIKSEYALDSQNYVEKSFDPNATTEISCQQQQQSLLPLSSSPAEFPSTTTTPQQDQQQSQQQQYGGSQFEPPTSSSVLPASGVTTKSAAWKSNEARRPKTYNCTACNKWFTSSGHLKRHYNTTLHKNAVKSSGQPDPATMPISAHHHPARDPSSKSNRRSKAEAAAAAREQQQQQQASAQPLQPPEPARTPPDYAAVPAGAAGLTALSNYSASPSPTQLTNQANNISYVQQQQQQQNGANSHVFQQQYLQQIQPSANNSTVLNGHPNGLAGPSVHQQQTPLMSSQMRGLLNSTITTIVTKSESLMEDQQPQLHQQHSPMGMEMERISVDQQHLHPPGLQRISGMEQLLDHQQQAYQLELQRQYHSSTPSSTHSSILTQSPPPLIISHQQYLEQLQQQQQLEDNTFCRTPPTPDSIHMQRQQQHNIIVEQQQQQQPFSITVLGTNTIAQQQQQPQQHNSNNMSPPLQRTITTATISNMDNIHIMHPPPEPNREQQQQPQAHIMSNTLLNNTSNTLEQQQSQQLQLPPPPLATIRNTTIHTPTITHNTIRIPSFQQLQQQAALSVPAVLGTEATMSYHTIIGNSNDQFPPPSADEQFFEQHYTTQMLTPDGQLLQLIPTQQLLNQPLYRVGTVTQSYAPSTPYTAHRSPQEADLPPANDHIQAHESSGAAMDSGGDGSVNDSGDSVLPITYASLSPKTNCLQDVSKNNTNKMILIQMEPNMMTSLTNVTSSTKPIMKQQQIRRNGTTSTKRKRNDCSGTGGGGGGGNDGKFLGELTSNGRIKCQQCDKTFTKTCYLTQHINCFHAGEYPFRCEKCGKRFQQEEAFEIHVERHQASEKAFKCHLCPKHYHHKTDLRRHIEGTHLNRKLHVCDICEKSFCRFDHLQKHISTHTRTRIPGKRSANKIKTRNDKNDQAVSEKTKDSVGNCIDHVASSIDSVVNNNCSNDSSDSDSTKNNSNNNNTNEVNLEKNIVESIDQKIVIKLEDQEFLIENANDHNNRVLLSSPTLSTPYILPHEKVLVKQEYQMIEQEIPIC